MWHEKIYECKRVERSVVRQDHLILWERSVFCEGGSADRPMGGIENVPGRKIKLRNNGKPMSVANLRKEIQGIRGGVRVIAPDTHRIAFGSGT